MPRVLADARPGGGLIAEAMTRIGLHVWTEAACAVPGGAPRHPRLKSITEHRSHTTATPPE